MQVTRYQRQVKTNAVSAPKLSLPEDTFGQSIAKGLGDVGSVLGGVAEDLRQQAINTAVEERMTGDERKIQDALYGQNGFMSQLGANAMGSTTRFDEFVEKLSDEAKDSFANETERRLYEKRMAPYKRAVRNSLLNHEFQQVQAHGKSVKVARINGLGEGVVFASGSPELYHQNMSEYITNVAEYGQKYLGLRGDALKQYTDNAVSKNVVASVQYQISTAQNIDRANQIYEEAKTRGMLTSGDATMLGKTIEPIRKAHQSKIYGSALAEEYFMNKTPETLTPISHREALRMVVDDSRFKDRTPEEQVQIAKSLVSGVQAFVAREDARRANKIALLKKGIDSNRPLAEQDVSNLSVKQVDALNFYQTYAKKGVYDYATQNALWENSGQLALMSESDFEAIMLTIAPEVATAMRQERERLLNPDTEKSPPPEKEIRDMVLAEIYTSNPDLASDDNRVAREVLLYDTVERVKVRTRQLGRRPDHNELVAIVHQSLPTYIGRPDLTWFRSESALKQNHKLNDTLEDIAEVVGIDPSNPYALIQLGQRIKMNDPRLHIPNRVYVEGLLNKGEKEELLRLETKHKQQLNPIQILDWLIDKRSGTVRNVYGIRSDNANKYSNIDVEEAY